MNYEINGVFIQPFFGNGVFIGSMNVNPAGSLIGELYDAYGRSKIEGNLNLEQEEFEFIKRYLKYQDNPNHKIIYSFRKSSGGLWEGSFDGLKCLNGDALCEIIEQGSGPKISLDKWIDIAQSSSPRETTIDNWIKGTIDILEKKGAIEIRKDSETGEDIIYFPKPESN